MSRVHEALRRAEQAPAVPAAPPVPPPTSAGPPVRETAPKNASAAPAVAPSSLGITPELLERIREHPFTPARDAHLIDLSRPNEAPAEEFRTLRTRLNHLQT